MSLSPYLILSQNGEISDCTNLSVKLGDIIECDTVNQKFNSSLASGDTKQIKDFCKREYSLAGDNFLIVRIIDFYSYNYVFLEKNLVSGEVMNIAFLGHEVFDFAELISPSAELYQSIVGKCVYEILSLKSISSKLSGVTPEMFLLTENLPEIKEEILGRNLAYQCCDISEVISHITALLKEEEFYPSVEFSCEYYNVTDGKPRSDETKCTRPMNYKVPVSSFVYLFMAIAGVLSTISADHKIKVTVSYYSCFAEVEFSAIADYQDSLSGRYSSLSCLGDLAAGYENLAAVSSAVAFSSDIGMNVSVGDGKINAILGLDYFADMKPKFRYNDPYESIASVVGRSLKYFNSIKNIAG
ncbi:MAG: hypothetical protein E7672_05990 [Ruminococcaceae bacterium]|nr:hypothetical protein [Oscillospiraceae bacterium]